LTLVINRRATRARTDERLALAPPAYNALAEQTTAMTVRLSRPFLRSGFVVALVVVFALAMLPLPAPITVVSFQDKIEHGLAFLALTLLGQAGWPAQRMLIALGLVLYGALIEIAQHWLTTHRVGDPADVLANSIGVAVGTVVALRAARSDRGLAG
jgi:VanZ family protein